MDLKNAEIITAMVTPFNDQGDLDFDRLEQLIEHLLATGSQGILVAGTTGEGPTLTEQEKLALIKRTVKLVAGRVPIIAGTGTNNTQTTIDFTNRVAEIDGVAAALVVVPYYNKPDQRGMLAHFKAVAAASKLPLLIYNIPGRTGVTMEVATIAELAQNQNIIGLKDCTGNVNLSRIVEQVPADFLVYTGEDADALAAKTIGAQGVISVASHLFGKELTKMYQAVEQGNYLAAADLMRKLTPAMSAMFSAPSPSPTKAALNHLGILVGGCRLPILNYPANELTNLYNKLSI
ncbi:MAG: 4-hydroxy-tetrahydrodipicolinate synthase [Liquorilactobacillus ghanensis]|uniref:4-hydroxy-tetrahydrodipicolinate synthase n=1 Tax=Liquorilactobacillus ghanensis DSM 18630 TaxID=1423750 RepID=A0A0R1VV27_9LACO|nr:4-hydroxy-tetrahydrodipicolinate synthase [Liquorilactobacillus ghanensis]KRM07707.1 dihydrodipicolinate synthase [Liquorilactobacillus ghanensis DSM 18630]